MGERELDAGGSKALDIGGIVNLLARFKDELAEEGRKVTAVQNRLIMKRVEEDGLDAPAASELGRERQLGALAVVVGDVIGMETADVANRLRRC